MFGITETTVHVTYRPLFAADLVAGSMIGKPIPDLQIYLLDEQQRPVPAGQAGEIYVGGAAWRCPRLSESPGTDRAEIRSEPLCAPGRNTPIPIRRSGSLPPGWRSRISGRIDSQVKIRGFRIELGEISALLDSYPGVRESVVVAAESIPGEKILVAYVVSRPGAAVTPAALRHVLRERLPEYMVPAVFMFIDRVPLTVNGKLDLKALPPPVKSIDAVSPAAVAAGSTLEKGIASIWCEVLNLPTVGFRAEFLRCRWRFCACRGGAYATAKATGQGFFNYRSVLHTPPFNLWRGISRRRETRTKPHGTVRFAPNDNVWRWPCDALGVTKRNSRFLTDSESGRSPPPGLHAALPMALFGQLLQPCSS